MIPRHSTSTIEEMKPAGAFVASVLSELSRAATSRTRIRDVLSVPAP